MQQHWYAVVMAGGAGTRFWPASTKHNPKQLLSLGTSEGESLLQGTVRRLSSLFSIDRIYLSTGQHLVDATRQALPDIPSDHILAEPAPRNTAPCIAWASEVIRAKDPDAIVAVLSADHVAVNEDAFQTAIERAMTVAQDGPITTLGIIPTRPETGYGYIQTGSERADGALDAVRFVEKPDIESAKKMLQDGGFLWNAGFFFFHVNKMREAIATHLPALSSGVDAIMADMGTDKEAKTLQDIFPELPSVSIDVGVMERVSPLAVVPSDFGWSDVGSWQTAWELAAHDSSGNAAPEDTVMIDSSGNLVSRWSSASAGKVIALVGVRDLVVVETDQALLVMPRERSQDVRQVVAALRERGRTDVL